MFKTQNFPQLSEDEKFTIYFENPEVNWRGTRRTPPEAEKLSYRKSSSKRVGESLTHSCIVEYLKAWC